MTRSAPGKMFGDVCSNCMRPHGGVPCRHNPDARCTTCGQDVGFLWCDTPSTACWFCVMGEQRPAPRAEPMRAPDLDEWV